MMEHRQAHRLPASTKLLMYRQGVPVAIGRLLNLSSTGLFVKTEYSDVDLNQKVEVEFQLSVSGVTECRRLNAIVVHKENSGLGLEIMEDDQTYQSVLEELSTLRSGISV